MRGGVKETGKEAEIYACDRSDVADPEYEFSMADCFHGSHLIEPWKKDCHGDKPDDSGNQEDHRQDKGWGPYPDTQGVTLRKLGGGVPTRYRPQEKEESIYQPLIGDTPCSLGWCYCIENEIC